MFRGIWNALKKRFEPRYEVADTIFFRGQLITPGFRARNELKTWDCPNSALVPINRTARLRMKWWRRSLPHPATRAQQSEYLGNFRQFQPEELRPLPNLIMNPTVWRRRPHSNWYDYIGPRIIPLSKPKE